MNSSEAKASFFKDYSWQERSVDHLMANLPDFYNTVRGKFAHAFIVEVSPSGGKSAFALKAVRSMIEAGLIDKAFIIVPRETIKDGFKDDCKYVVMETSRRLPGGDTIRVDDELGTKYTGLLSNYHAAVINYQSLDRFLGPDDSGYFNLLAKAGVRTLFIFDEVHHGKGADSNEDGCANEWGKAMAKVRELAHAIICMTGTPIRTDEDPVPYLRYELSDQFDPKTGQVTKAYYVKPDFKFSYAMAIKAGVARKLIFRPQDPTVAFRYGKDGEMVEYNGPLSAVPKHLVDRAKRELFSPDRGHIDDMLRLAIEENRLDRKIGDAEAAINVVVGSTDEQARYNPLVHVASRIKALFGETAVTVESSDGAEARAAVNRFRNSTERWIVSKDMISEGTSIPRLRTQLLLRDIKSPVRFEQVVHRITRNRSDEFAQDAKVILFRLPEMMIFAGAIEEEIRLVVPAPSPTCPACHRTLEFRPRRGKPCTFCGYEPPPGPGPGPETSLEFEWLFSEFGEEVVVQGGDDYSKYDPITRVILGKFGQNPHYGGRHGMNEIFRAADEANLINLAEAKKSSPFSDDELMKKYWNDGLKLCEQTAGPLSRAQGLDFQETLRKITGECKRAAGMGRDKKETVMRDYKDPVGTFRKFYEAAQHARERAGKRHGSAA